MRPSAKTSGKISRSLSIFSATKSGDDPSSRVSFFIRWSLFAYSLALMWASWVGLLSVRHFWNLPAFEIRARCLVRPGILYGLDKLGRRREHSYSQRPRYLTTKGTRGRC